MLAPGGKGNDQYEVDANGKIVPRKSNSKHFYTMEWENGVPKQVAHPVGPRATPPVWDANAQAADDEASQKWGTYLSSLPAYGSPTPTPASPTVPNPTVNTAASSVTGIPAQAPTPGILNPSSMARQLSPQTMVQMKSPLQNGLFGKPLWKGGFKGSFNL
jgi:hypothetical protein